MIIICKKINLIIFSILVIVVSALLLIIGSYRSKDNKSYPRQAETELIDTSIIGNLEIIIKSDIQKKDSNIKFDKFNIISSDNKSYGKIVIYLFQSKNVRYEGLCILSNNSKITNDYTIVDEKAPFTVHQLGGSTDVIGENFIIFSGVVNNKDIDSLLMEFNDSSKVNIKIGENRSYNYIKSGSNCKLNDILALDKKLNSIFKYPPYPPQNP